ncbi:uncharacterized protein LOC106647444 [Copidosoma floridanum]|uniref:uncharacterized protein LOC106647444 n=1 Tax=Copidosoma floridanum TaxID=29053 RepID=UPI000C6F618C|nr:uncharacterized protein LOC106647444 [Copidosoma floridanum]
MMLETTESARLYITLCVLFSHGSGIAYATMFTFTQEPVTVNNATIRPLAYPGYFYFFDPLEKPYYDFLVVADGLIALSQFTMNTAVHSFAIICVMHICGQIEVTSAMLKDLFGKYDDGIFKNIIKKHLGFLNFAAELENVLNEMCFVEVIGCTFNICMLGFYCLTEYDPDNLLAPIMYTTLFISFTFNIFILSFIGDKLTIKCNSIGDIAYMVNWYEFSGKEARNLVLTIAATNRPVVLTTGKIATLSLRNFGNVRFYNVFNSIEVKSMRNAADFEYAVQMTRWLLQPLGIWPRDFSTFPLVARLASVAMCTFLLAFLLIPCCLQMFLIEKDLGVRLKMIGPLSFCLMSVFKYFALLAKGGEVGSCLSIIAGDWDATASPDRRSFMLDNARTARYFTSVCALFMYGGGLPYSTILPLTREAIVVGNGSYRHLAYPSYFVFFNPHVRPVYDVVFVAHCLCGFVMYSVTVGLCSVAILCIMHICSQCSITSSILRGVRGSLDEKTYGKIVKQHMCSIRFASKLEGILNKMCLVEMIGCTFNICMLGYYLITDYEQSEVIGSICYGTLLVSLTFNIFIFCYIGDLLSENCQEIGKVAYAIDWYKISGKEARHLVMVVALTQRPVLLTAGKMVDLSIGSFCNVLKASVTYLNMLRTLTANQD